MKPMSGLINTTVCPLASLPSDLSLVSDQLWVDPLLTRPEPRSCPRCLCGEGDDGEEEGCQDNGCMNFATYGAAMVRRMGKFGTKGLTFECFQRFV
mmetsp:Transcript_20201/g.40446  ORF Transcript_20201/g.40446 Transcript_20201/m.40446 type:complete len:96 (-) Transcript_20201:19-306(-)